MANEKPKIAWPPGGIYEFTYLFTAVGILIYTNVATLSQEKTIFLGLTTIILLTGSAIIRVIRSIEHARREREGWTDE